MTRLALLCVLLIAACAPPDNTPQGVCARRAEEDPAVKELVMLSATNQQSMNENRYNLRLARKQAENRCLTGMGLMPPGGVEAERPTSGDWK